MTRHRGLGSYREWPEDQRVAFLTEALRQASPANPLAPSDLPCSPEVREVFETCGKDPFDSSLLRFALDVGLYFF